MIDLINKEFITSLTKKATDILFVQNPRGTSLGILLGFIVDGLFLVLRPLFISSQIIDISSINIFYFIALGIFLFNLPLYFRRQQFDPKIEEALAFIKDAKKHGNLSENQIRQMYRNLCEKVLQGVELDI